MKIIDEILNKNEFVAEPPILLDIGASGKMNPKWKRIAKYCICVAFDADNRDLNHIESETKEYKKLYIYNSLVTDDENKQFNFYLTHFPHCSSLLKPNTKSLSKWAFSELFDVSQILEIDKSVSLKTVLDTLKIVRIDWYKSDSQGIDLRLFDSLDNHFISKILVAEFEPGIIDAYYGEDKLYSLLDYMQEKPFWISSMEIRGSQRISRETMNKKIRNFEKKNISVCLKLSPGWAEVTYINTLETNSFSKRDLLLAWIFAILEKQYGFALDILQLCSRVCEPDSLFEKMEKFTLRVMRWNFYKQLPQYFMGKLTNRLSSILSR